MAQRFISRDRALPARRTTKPAGHDRAGPPHQPLDLVFSASGLAEPWSPRVAGQVNDVLLKVVRLAGDFVWHNHPDTDEAFLCLSGSRTIDLRDVPDRDERTLTLNPEDLYVIPRRIYHCPHSAEGAAVALFEAAGVTNTGAAGGALTAPVDPPL